MNNPPPIVSSPAVLLEERRDAIVILTLNRPHRLNALDRALWRALGDVFRRLGDDTGVRAVILRGADGAFCAGGDIHEFPEARKTPEDARAYTELMLETLAALDACPHPVVAAIEGPCFGGGVELALGADIRICGGSARFGIPINRLGFVMSHAELRRLVGLVGRGPAMELLLEARTLDATEALQRGLVTRIAYDAAVIDEAVAAAERIAAGAPLVNRWHKAFARRLEEPTPLSAAEIEEGFACFSTEDYRLGVSGFIEKTRPEFQGR